MRIGIDGSNLRGGGGLTHIAEVLEVADPNKHGFEEIVIWGGTRTLERMPARSWLRCVHHPWLDRSIAFRLLWKSFYLTAAVRRSCDVLFAPGGLYTGGFQPFVTMCQNMLPFEDSELSRYGLSYVYIRNKLLKVGQLRTFKNSRGVIFLSKYAKNYVGRFIDVSNVRPISIAHGVDPAFRKAPRRARMPSEMSNSAPFRVLYVSIIDEYKHQWVAAKAAIDLRKEGIPVQLDLVGPAYEPSFKRLLRVITSEPGAERYIKYHGEKSKQELISIYRDADMFLFGSSCENLPNILIEAMSAGLPIASSNRGPMPEVLQGAGIYFDPELEASTANAMRELFNNAQLRMDKAGAAYELARAYSWNQCADETFAFLSLICREAN